MAIPSPTTEPAQAALPTLIDNRPGNQMLEALRRLIAEAKTLDVATGFFEVGALVDLDGHWQKLQSMRLLMGDDFTRKTKKLLIDALSDPGKNGIERAKEEDDWKALDGLEAIKAAILNKMIQAKVYTRAKFHAKAYHFHTGGMTNHGIIGSSNFTHPGLTQNVELNLLTRNQLELDALATWYENAWKEAEDISLDLLGIIEPHIRPYSPFEVYLQAMRERFFGLEPEEAGWEQTESQIYPLLAKYQQDAYHDLEHMAKTWGGGLLCDGVGLGKTYVGLTLIERARHEKHKVLVIAPKATIPSVWEKNLAKFFPDDFGRFTDDIRVMAHTDFGRDGGVTYEEIEKLRKRYETIIVDEAHHFRVPSRNRSKKLKALTKGLRLFMLTATPVNNSILDLYNLINYISQDRQNYFQKVNVANLRGWFGKMMDERELEQLTLDFADMPEYREFLKHIIVQRSRKYVKSLEKQDDQSVQFPTREKPDVVSYSLSDVYGQLLPDLFRAFDTKRAQLKLVIYETEKFKQRDQDDQTLLQQSQVVGLIRTMLLKRLESSQKALEASIEDLLLKHITLMRDLQPMEHEVWLSENRDVFDALQKHRLERTGAEADDEEEDELPLTSYETRMITAVRADMALFGRHEPEWRKGLKGDIEVLTKLLKGMHEVTRPENDAKLLALVDKIGHTQRLRKEKVVLFSEFKDTARYLETELKKRLPNDAIVEVDSGRNVKNREDVIRRFAPYYNCETPEECQKALKDPIRVLISTDVLSEGLNLQDAHIIVNYDLHWNPVRLMQRIGRVDRRMDPSKPVKYDKVYVYNFLPPEELDDMLGLYKTITGKLIAINRTLGIEAPVLTANDDFAAMDFYQNLGESQMSVSERLRLKAHELAKTYPDQWSACATFPNRIYSGKAAPPPIPALSREPAPARRGEGVGGEVPGRGKPSNTAQPTQPAPATNPDTLPLVGRVGERSEPGKGAPRADQRRDLSPSPKPNTQNPTPSPAGALFLAYRIPTGPSPDDAESMTYDVRWFMLDRETGELIEDLNAIHEQIECGPNTKRILKTDRAERDRLRKTLEDGEISKIRYKSQIPMATKDELICWLEIG